MLVLLEVGLALELVEFLVTTEVIHPVWVMEGAKGSMIVIGVSVGVVAESGVGADGSAEMIERAKPTRHEQQGARSLL